MKLVVSCFAGFIGMAAVPAIFMLSMPVAFSTAGLFQQDWVGDILIWVGILLAVATAVIHVRGQIKYWKLTDDQRTRPSLVMMYAPAFVVLFLSLIFLLLIIFE